MEKLLELGRTSLHRISHLIFIWYILFLLFYINCLFQLHTLCNLGWQSVAINGTKNLNQKCIYWTLDTVYKTCFGDCFQNVVLQRNKMMGRVQWCVSSVAHHKHKTSVTFSCIHKVHLFNVGTKKAKDSYRKNYKIVIQEANDYMKHILENLNSFLISHGIRCLVWNVNVTSR